MDMINFLLRDPNKWDCLAKKVVVIGRSNLVIDGSPEV